MPIYEYVCKDCQKEIEIFQGFKEMRRIKCPSCDGKLKKLISQNAFHLKGRGWYKDGYSNNAGDNNETSN